MADQEPLDLEAYRADINRAHTEVGEICRRTGPGRWRMSIPARPDRDSDLLISTGLHRGGRLADEVERLRAELERLHEGEAADPGKPGTWPTPAQWIRRWNDMTPERRLEIAGGAVDGMQVAAVCRYQPGHEGQIAELRAERDVLTGKLDQLRAYARWCSDRSVDPETRDLLAIADGREHHDYVILMKRGTA